MSTCGETKCCGVGVKDDDSTVGKICSTEVADDVFGSPDAVYTSFSCSYTTPEPVDDEIIDEIIEMDECGGCDPIT